MKKVLVIAIGAVVSWSVVSCTAKSSQPVSLKTQADSISYVIGQDVGQSLKGLKTDVNLAVFTRAVEDVLKERTPLLDETTANTVRQAFGSRMQEDRARESKEASEKNVTDGEKFLEENKAKKGVITTPSGLQYMVIKQGTGPKPKATDKVSVHYRGTLLDGKEFDSSHKRGEPATFVLNQVIPGWTEGVQLMSVGSTYKFFVPPALAYGERGAPPVIGPNATLIFEVELLKIEK